MNAFINYKLTVVLLANDFSIITMSLCNFLKRFL